MFKLWNARFDWEVRKEFIGSQRVGPVFARGQKSFGAEFGKVKVHNN